MHSGRPGHMLLMDYIKKLIIMNRIVKSEKNQTHILVAASYSGAATRWHSLRGSKSLSDMRS